MAELWKDIDGYEGIYEVSNKGNVRRKGCVKYKSTKRHNRGYLQVELSKYGSSKTYLVHRLVADAFIDNPNKYPIVNHKDEDKTNNSSTNLEWCTLSYNVNYSKKLCDNGTPIPRKLLFRVLQFDSNKNLLKVWSSITEIKAIMNFHPTSIKECCEGKRKTAYGYKWLYAIDNICGRETAL